MADGQTNIRITLDLGDMQKKAKEYRDEVTRMGIVTDEEGKVVSSAWERVAQTVEKTDIGTAVRGMTADLSGGIAMQRQMLEELESQFTQVGIAVENAAAGMGTGTLQAEMAAIRGEIDNEKQALQGLELQLGQLNTAYTRLGEGQQAATSGTSQWEGVISGLNGVTGAFGAAQGVIELFGISSSKLAAIQTRLQAVMAITTGLQQTASTLHESSAFRLNVLSKVTGFFTAAQTRLALALGISTLAAQALMGALTLGLSVAITAVVALIAKFSEEQKKVTEEQQKVLDVQKRAAETSGEQIAIYEKLRNTWNSLGSDMASRKKFIEGNQAEFDKLGVSVSNVNEAENLLVTNKDAFIRSLQEKAKAMAAMELATKKYKEAQEKRAEAEMITPTQTDRSGKRTIRHKNSADGEKHWQLTKEAAAAEQAAAAYIQQQAAATGKYDSTLKNAGIKTTAEGKEERRGQQPTPKDNNSKDEKLRLEQAYTNAYANLLSSRQKMEYEAQQAKIDMQADGYEKSRAQLQLNLTKERDAIEQQQQDILALYQEMEKKKFLSQGGEEKDFKTTYDTAKELPQEVRDLGTAKLQAANAKYEEDTTGLLNEVLKKYQTFSQKRLDIETKYNNDIKALKQAGANPEQIGEAEIQKQDALAALDQETMAKNEAFQGFMQNITDMSMQQLMQNLQQARLLLAQSSLKGDDNKAAEARQKIKVLEEQIKVEQKEKDDKTDPAKKWKNTLEIMQNVSQGVGDIINNFEGLDETTKTALTAANNIAGGIIGMITGIQQLAITGQEAVKGAERASVILAIIAAAVQVLMVIMNLFNKDKKKEKNIQNLQKEIEKLDVAYQKLGRSIENTYSDDVFNQMDDQRDNLEEQNRLIQEQIAQEKGKKKTDEGKVADWEEQIRKNNQAIEDSKRKQIEMLAGTDIQSAIDEFADALVEAYAKGENAAEALGETTKKVMANAVKEALKRKFLGDAIQKAVNDLGNAMGDGALSKLEQANFENQVNKAGEQYLKAMKMYDNLFKGEEVAEGDVKSQAGIVGETITEKTASEMTGIWRGQYDTLKNIDLNVLSFQECYKSAMATCNVMLGDIALNTGATAGNTAVLGDINTTLSTMDSRLKTIENNSNKKFA